MLERISLALKPGMYEQLQGLQKPLQIKAISETGYVDFTGFGCFHLLLDTARQWREEGINVCDVITAKHAYMILQPRSEGSDFYEEAVWEDYITGLSHHGYREVARDLAPGTKVTLKPVINEFDDNAIGVFYKHHQIGWIPKNKKWSLPRILELRLKVEGRITYHRPLVGNDSHYQTCLKVKVTARIDLLRKLALDTTTSLTKEAATYTGLICDFKSAENRVRPEDFLFKRISDSSQSGGTAPSNIQAQTQAPIVKETKMTKLTNIISVNKNAATLAAQLEAGRIANKQAVKLISGKLPLMARGYADTPLARLAFANTVKFAADNYGDKLGKHKELASQVSEAMVVAAYSEIIANFDIDSMIEQFLEGKEMKKISSLLKQGDE